MTRKEFVVTTKGHKITTIKSSTHRRAQCILTTNKNKNCINDNEDAFKSPFYNHFVF